jgi:nuclear migration protein JNM1
VRSDRSRPHYAYPPSPDSPTSPTTHRPVPLSQRLRALQNELAALETEIADPSNPLLAKEREQDNVDPGELIRGLVDVRGRLEKISKGKEGRGRLVNVVLGNEEVEHREDGRKVDGVQKDGEGKRKDHEKGKAPDVRSVVEMDRRVGELEKLVGSSSTALDEVC